MLDFERFDYVIFSEKIYDVIVHVKTKIGTTG